MKKEIIRVAGISDALERAKVPLSTVTRAGDLVFVSGIPPLDPESGIIEIADISRQTERVLENIKLCLESAGSKLENVLKCTVYISNSGYFDAVNAVYARYFDKGPPARTFATVGSWPWQFDIEIECIALVD